MDLETKLSALRASDWKCYVRRLHRPSIHSPYSRLVH